MLFWWLCPLDNLDQQLQPTSMPVTVPCQVISVHPFGLHLRSSYQSIGLGRPSAVALMPSLRKPSMSKQANTLLAKSLTRDSWKVANTWSLLFLSIVIHPSLILINQVRNEIAVLKRISSGHRNIVTLHDYFEVCRSSQIQEVCTLRSHSEC